MNNATETAKESPAWQSLLPPLFAMCVDPEPLRRYALATPFVQDGYIYATDGRIAVRMPWIEPWEYQSKGNVPKNMASVLESSGKPMLDPLPLPVPEGLCECCLGSKVMRKHTCGQCGHVEGPGRCTDCLGTGVLDASESIAIDGSHLISRGFAKLLLDHGVTHVRPVIGDKTLQMQFSVGDIEGVVCGMTPEADR